MGCNHMKRYSPGSRSTRRRECTDSLVWCATHIRLAGSTIRRKSAEYLAAAITAVRRTATANHRSPFYDQPGVPFGLETPKSTRLDYGGDSALIRLTPFSGEGLVVTDRATARREILSSAIYTAGQGRVLPAAAFRNPFRDGLPEIMVARPKEDGSHLVRLSAQAHGQEWAQQIVMHSPTALTHVVTTTYRGSVRAYWVDCSGLVWRSLLTPGGFSAPAVLFSVCGTDMLRATYYVPNDGSPAEPVLYGVTQGRGTAEARLWIRTLREKPAYFTLPELLTDGNEFSLSMTGRRSWVVDAARGGYLRRWDGQVGGEVYGPLTYSMAGVEVARVFGTCGNPRLYFPQPLFVAGNGLAYLWNSRTGPLPCAASGLAVVHAETTKSIHGDGLVYLGSRDGRLLVARVAIWEGLGPHWSNYRIVSRKLAPATHQLVPTTYPFEPPALFAVGIEQLTLFTPAPLSAAAASHAPRWDIVTSAL